MRHGDGRVRRQLTAAVCGAGLVVLVSAAPASAHNAGHMTLPDGRCIDVGGHNEVRVGRDKHTLDLIPETPSPFDEFGASYAAFQGRTPLQPGPCH